MRRGPFRQLEAWRKALQGSPAMVFRGVEKPTIIDAEFRVVKGPKGPKPPYEPAIKWRNVPFFLWVVVVILAAQWVFKAVMGY